jgi:excisionase family DNA binding protein
MNRQPEDGYLETAQVCNLLGVHRSTLWRLVREGRLRQYTVAWSKHPRYRADEVRALREHPVLDQDATISQWAEVALDVVLLLDVEGRIRYLNPAGAAALGRPEEELLGESLARLLAVACLGPALEVLERALEGQAGRLPALSFRGAGSDDAWEASFTPVLREGTPAEVLVQARHVGPLRASEAISERLCRAAEVAPVGLLLTDLAGVILCGNSAAAELLGAPLERLPGQRLESWWSPANPIGTADAVQRAALGRGWQGELLLRAGDGQTDRWARVRVAAVREGPRVEGLVVLLEEWEAARERELNALKGAQLQGAVQALQALEASLSAPLQALAGSLRLLKMSLGPTDGLVDEGLQGALRTSEELARVCRGLWDLAGLGDASLPDAAEPWREHRRPGRS